MANYTKHYQLHQWEPEDPFLRTDFNEDLAKIDTALGGKGNCRIATGSYVGTGEYGQEHPNTIELPFPTRMIILDVTSDHGYNTIPRYYILFRQASAFMGLGTSSSNWLTWTDNTVSWYYGSTDSDGAKFQFNSASQTYHYIAIG